MLTQLPSVFLDVVAPVFAIVALGWAIGPRLGLDARTLSRAAYYVFVPAFTFDVISRSEVPLAAAGRMAAYAVLAHLAFGAIAFVLARLLRRPREVTAAYVMLSVFGNVGNFGLALITFRLGPEALAPATIYFIVILLTSFVVCVGAAAFTRGGGLAAVGSVFRTPALLVAVPAAFVSANHLAVPLFVSRAVGLLGGAMIPTMLFVLGVQLAQTKALRMGSDVAVVTALRLVGAPAVAWLLATPFRLTGLERASGILQAGMPAAILVAIIATEYEIEPGFVTSAVLFSTLASLPTLTLLLALV
jgi:malate permease and related proteins